MINYFRTCGHSQLLVVVTRVIFSLRSSPLRGLCDIPIFLVQRFLSNGGNLCVIQPEIM